MHYFAVLIGVGATTVNAYLAQESIADRHRRGLFGTLQPRRLPEALQEAVDAGLLKIMSKMGISVISSYRGGYNFEAIGLSRALVAEFFPGMPSRISGIGLAGIAAQGARPAPQGLARGYGGHLAGRRLLQASARRRGPRLRGRADPHAADAVTTDSLSDLQALFRGGARSARRSPLRDLLDFRTGASPPSRIDEVESITEIRKRFVTPGMSLGALSPEAHGTLNIAMNRIGAKSDSGEGGEDPARYKPRPTATTPTPRSSRSPRAASA